ncbi:unnamed protein product, partial [Ectocarpus sp. 12 AP-2014]
SILSSYPLQAPVVLLVPAAQSSPHGKKYWLFPNFVERNYAGASEIGLRPNDIGRCSAAPPLLPLPLGRLSPPPRVALPPSGSSPLASSPLPPFIPTPCPSLNSPRRPPQLFRGSRGGWSDSPPVAVDFALRLGPVPSTPSSTWSLDVGECCPEA